MTWEFSDDPNGGWASTIADALGSHQTGITSISKYQQRDAVTQRYTIQSGDTLVKIAERVYGDGNQWTRIRDANSGIDPNNLQIGQQLTLPPGSSPQQYTIQPGDTLVKIAERVYGDGNQWTRIRDANPGIDPNNLRIGQQLTLPTL
jgi:nucleoid-associated protein YgaU